MITHEVLSHGEIKVEVPAVMASYYLTNFYNDFIPTPVEVLFSTMLFDFQRHLAIEGSPLESQLKRVNMFSDRTRQDMERMIALLGRVVNNTDPDALGEYLTKQGIPENRVEDLAVKIGQEIETLVLRSGTGSSVIKDILTKNMKLTDLSTVKDFETKQLHAALIACHNLYGKFVDITPAAEIGEHITTLCSNDAIFKLVRFVYMTFNRVPGPTTMVKTSYILDTFFEGIFGRKFLETEDMLTGHVTKITNVPYFEDLSFVDAIAAYFIAQRAAAGLATSKDTATWSYDQYLKQIVFDIGVDIPLMPAELSDYNEDRVNKLIRILWFQRMIVRAARGDFGEYVNRIDNVRETKKYTRDDSFANIIQDGVNIASLIIESYLDTGAMIKSILLNENIYFNPVDNGGVYIHPVNQDKYKKWMIEHLAQFQNWNLRQDNARFYNQEILMASRKIDFGFVMPEYLLTDADAKIGTRQIFTADESRIEYKVNEIIDGSYHDTKMPVSPRFLAIAEKMEPSYFISLPKPAIMTKDYMKVAFGILPIKKLLDTELRHYFEPYSRLEWLKDELEMANLFGIPLDLAKKLWDPAEDMYIDMRSYDQQMFIWRRETGAMYEITKPELIDMDVEQFVRPFLTYYPFCIKRRLAEGYAGTGFAVENSRGNLGIVEDKNKLELGNKGDIKKGKVKTPGTSALQKKDMVKDNGGEGAAPNDEGASATPKE